MPFYMAEEAAIDRAGRRDLQDARHIPLFLANSAVLFTTVAALVVSSAAVTNPSSAVTPANALLGLVLFLLGVSLAMLVPVADQFPGAARIGVAVATALRAYLFGA
uniref:Uncharacterized protein n=1 Tax=Oryza punctata TaxID=4537 RepID=A0A0E0LEL5_ORYPU